MNLLSSFLTIFFIFFTNISVSLAKYFCQFCHFFVCIFFGHLSYIKKNSLRTYRLSTMKAGNDKVLVLQFARVWAVVVVVIVGAAKDTLLHRRISAIDHRTALLAALATWHPVFWVIVAPFLVASGISR